MNPSDQDKHPLLPFEGEFDDRANADREVPVRGARPLGRDRHSCARIAHALSKDAAVFPPESANAPYFAVAGFEMRHASCSMEERHQRYQPEKRSRRRQRRTSRPFDDTSIHSKGFGFVRDDSDPSFIGAASPSTFSRMETGADSSVRVASEGIVRQPSRRDSQCVPQ